ncbi:VWA domain containing CoxE-like protein [Pigmentiphaga humi]|uniref:VWA domain containing CoxE-like protein n=1 Tax=Pigmentiphaga humi TaxID=2478468 RepID=A0A3P4B0R0_9BURK|nr:VWA domain-containing protein [Pigmentiphaga humi]VCU69874.1 VWA domain containing CoxE-like protein [Pigmentiphaga humi]
MPLDFFYHLRRHRLPVSIKEYLTLLEALSRQVVAPSVDDFYLLARLTLVKDESHFDRYDRAFASYYKGVEAAFPPGKDIPEEWLLQRFQRELSDEDRAAIEKLGWDKLMELFRQRLAEQKERHEGGSKWIGTGGTSPFGSGGYHPEGIRIGKESGGNRTAVKAWDMRSFRDYDDQVELGTRNIKVALRRLRRFAREGAEQELDLDDTIRSTARNAGHLDIRMVPERHNAVKVLMLLDVGGTMDSHVARIEELFSAARSEFKHLEVYYFHNCLYDRVWQNNRRRHAERTDTWDLLRKYNADWRLVFVGDATMSPYEILQPGGSVEYHNEEAGAVWLQRMAAAYPHFAWLNPEPQGLWPYRQSIDIIRKLLQDRMYPVTLDGLERAMRQLSK